MLPTELTFIILARTDVTTDIRNCDEWSPSDESMPSREEIDSFPMIGDVNLFLKGMPSDEDFEAEVEIMIAGESGQTIFVIGIYCTDLLKLASTYCPVHPRHHSFTAKQNLPTEGKAMPCRLCNLSSHMPPPVLPHQSFSIPLYPHPSRYPQNCWSSALETKTQQASSYSRNLVSRSRSTSRYSTRSRCA